MDEKGIFHIPMALVLAVCACIALGFLAILMQWRKNVATQLRLDRCVGRAALELKSRLVTIDSANLRLIALRQAASQATHPVARASLIAAVTSQAVLQDYQRARWTARQVAWLIPGNCFEKGDIPIPLPSMAYERGAPDSLGPQPLTWSNDQPKNLKVRMHHRPRGAAAQVQKTGVLDDWKASWTTFAIGTSID